jgi:hypothetical protein
MTGHPKQCPKVAATQPETEGDSSADVRWREDVGMISLLHLGAPSKAPDRLTTLEWLRLRRPGKSRFFLLLSQTESEPDITLPPRVPRVARR